MSQRSILVCGAGIAGSTLAFWLGKAGNSVTIIERAPEIRNSGLGVDIRGPAVEVIRRMGLEEQIRSRTTGEEGLAFVDTRDHVFALFEIDQENLENSPTSEIEIMRSDLAQLISTAALDIPNVRVEYGASVETISQNEDEVSVGFTSGESATFDMVIAADGLGSTTRKLILGGDNEGPGPVRSLGQYTAYFTIPREERDGMLWKWYNATGSRVLTTRPKNADTSCAYLSIMPRDEKRIRNAMKGGMAEQKKELTTLFDGAGWQTPRLLGAMQNADDLYVQQIAQVILPSWHSGRCAVVGDAAYCPSPLSGVGTSLAILGAYVLAGEIVKFKEDPRAALQAYEEKLRPYVLKKQHLPPGVPRLASPSTAWGISVFNWIVWFVASSGISKWFSGGSAGEDDNFSVSEYSFD